MSTYHIDAWKGLVRDKKMKTELQTKLAADFPQILDPWIIEVGDGWYNLIYDLCSNIMELNPPKDFKAARIKEKFGGLRFYCYNSTYEIDQLIGKAEIQSYNVCENCGSRDSVISEGGWIKTLCKECRG